MNAHTLAPLAMAVPLAVAALCVALGTVLPKRSVDVLSILAGIFCTYACVALTMAAAHGTIVHWFGGWVPRHGVALGIAFVVDPIGGALAAFVAFLTTAAFVFAWTYYDEAGPPFHALMLAFLGAMVGFFLTGDLFNLFVFFELMGVAAYALTAYRTEDRSAVAGAFSFAVVNSAGAFLILIGIALLYARTGALNMAQIAHALGSRGDALVVVAFALITVGLLVKAAIVPFHFWLSDAHAVAPTPLCVLFSGIMVQAGLYAVARCWWSVFSGALSGDEHGIRALLLAFGLLTAFGGAIMCFAQRHVKRLLAFSTIAHSGILLCAIALLSARGIGGFCVYVVGHGLLKGGLFMCSGILLNRFGSVDVEQLRNRLRKAPWLGLAFAFGALGLAGMPPFGTFLGKAMIDDAAKEAALPWLPFVLLIPAALTGGSVLNAAARMTLGWGSPPDPGAQSPAREKPEAEQQDGSTPFVMFATAAVLLLLAFASGLVAHAEPSAHAAGARFVERAQQIAVTLGGAAAQPLARETPAPFGAGVSLGVAATLAAFAFAAIALLGRRTPVGGSRRSATQLLLAPLRAVHSGMVTDYLAWLAAGTATFGGILLLLRR